MYLVLLYSLLRLSFGNLHGVGDEHGLFGEYGLVAQPVFVEAGYDAVTILCDEFVQSFFGCPQPVALIIDGFGISTKGVADVEVTIAQGLVEGASMNPVPIHAEGPKKHPFVVLAEVTVEPEEPFGLQFEEHGVDELYDIVAS